MKRAAPTFALSALAVVSSLALWGCGPKEVVRPEVAPLLDAHGTFAQDTAPKEELRMVPPEAYMRTYLMLFGGLAPLDVQARARGGDGAQLFDTWDDYFSALGFPDYHLDLPRGAQTNALMVAAFERLGVALCDRAVEHDLEGKDFTIAAPPPPPPPMGRRPGKKGGGGGKRDRWLDRQLGTPDETAAQPSAPPDAKKLIFTFDVPTGPMDAAAFAPRFDVLHRTFLGYPADLAPTDRTTRFFALYATVVARHAAKQGKSRFTPSDAGWAAVCYGLVRHPEFQFY